MKFLVYGAGTIGLSYAWLLSSAHEIDVFVRPERLSQAQDGYNFLVHDLRKKPAQELRFIYTPNAVTDMHKHYDAILVTVNRCQIDSVLPALRGCDADIVFMQNNWDIEKSVSAHLPAERYLIGFPSQVGGGREENQVDVNVYGEGTVLGEASGQTSERLLRYKRAFEDAGLTVEVKDDILSWLKVHYLQQSISAGAILKAGGYTQFARDYAAVKEMVFAFREGVAVCRACGVDTKRIFPASLFRYPAPLVAFAMKRMFGQPETATMVTGHMKQGLQEWMAGYYEVLQAGEQQNVPMPVWRSYKPFVDVYALERGWTFV